MPPSVDPDGRQLTARQEGAGPHFDADADRPVDAQIDAPYLDDRYLDDRYLDVTYLTR
jgi:hypothetical protein